MLYVVSNKKLDFNKKINKSVIFLRTINSFLEKTQFKLLSENIIITFSIDDIDVDNYFISKHNSDFKFINVEAKRLLSIEHKIYIKKIIRNDKITKILNKKY